VISGRRGSRSYCRGATTITIDSTRRCSEVPHLSSCLVSTGLQFECGYSFFGGAGRGRKFEFWVIIASLSRRSPLFLLKH
jgi:hypothetical protein